MAGYGWITQEWTAFDHSDWSCHDLPPSETHWMKFHAHLSAISSRPWSRLYQELASGSVMISINSCAVTVARLCVARPPPSHIRPPGQLHRGDSAWLGK